MTDRDIPCIPEGYLLGLYARLKTKQVTTRFIDLVLIISKSQITRNWKSAKGPNYKVWLKELEKWAEAEGALLHREAKRGQRKIEFVSE